MPAGEIVWEDPPPPGMPGKRGGDSAALVAKLKLNPGKWARVREGPANSLRSTSAYLKRRYGLEVTTRGIGDGRTALYARWPEIDF